MLRIDKSAFRDVEFEPAREADVVKIKVGAGRFFFDDVDGEGVGRECWEVERVGVLLPTTFEIGFLGRKVNASYFLECVARG